MINDTSYKITTQTITSNGANTSIILLVVEFQSDVNLTENATISATVETPINGVKYTISQIIAAKPSGILIGQICTIIQVAYVAWPS